VPIIGVGHDAFGWYERLVDTLEQQIARGVPVRYEVVEINAHDWVARLDGLDALIWHPMFMGPVSASFLKEKIWFIERFADLRVMPNFSSVWPFESKVAESYVFGALDIPSPKTVVSFDYWDALEAASTLGLPVVAKRSYGAGSSNVYLLRTAQEVDEYLQRELSQQLWDEHKNVGGSSLAAATSGLPTPWLKEKVKRKVLGGERHGYIYLQEFLPDNDRDLRVTVVGRRVAAHWRENREGDWRASGSGREDHVSPVPREALDLCIEASARIGCDSMSYDVLFRDGKPLVIEMSYCEGVGGFPGGYWIRDAAGELEHVDGHVHDQELWVLHMLEQFGRTPVIEAAQAAP
jgi:glutathione synthase/RimK-type ligase-like ATP-grasp enzyme